MERVVYQYPRQGGMEGQEPSRMAWDSVADVHGWGGEGHGRGKKQEMKLEKQVRAIADRGGTRRTPYRSGMLERRLWKTPGHFQGLALKWEQR